MFYVYVLYSPVSDRFYVGQTEDVEQRLEFHNTLSVGSYTSRHRPWELRKVIGVGSKRMAIQVERYIKGRKSRRYIERLCEEEAAVARLLDKFDDSAG